MLDNQLNCLRLCETSSGVCSTVKQTVRTCVNVFADLLLISIVVLVAVVVAAAPIDTIGIRSLQFKMFE